MKKNSANLMVKCDKITKIKEANTFTPRIFNQYFCIPFEVVLNAPEKKFRFVKKNEILKLSKLFDSLEFYIYILKPEYKQAYKQAFGFKIKPEENDLLMLTSYICHVACEETALLKKSIRVLESLAKDHGYQKLFKPQIMLMKMTTENPKFYRNSAKGSLVFDIYNSFPNVDAFFDFFMHNKMLK